MGGSCAMFVIVQSEKMTTHPMTGASRIVGPVALSYLLARWPDRPVRKFRKHQKMLF